MPDARSERAQVIVLVGPKGAGKTTLARMLEQGLGLHFLEVEAIARRVLSDCGGTIELDNDRGLAPEQVCAAIRAWLRAGAGA